MATQFSELGNKAANAVSPEVLKFQKEEVLLNPNDKSVMGVVNLAQRDQQGMVKTPVIPADKVSGATPLNLPQPDYTSLSGEAGAMTAGLTAGQKSLQDYMKALTPEDTEADKAHQAVLNRMADLAGQNTGRVQTQIEQENAQGVPNLQKSLADVNAQITTGLAELTKIDADLTRTMVDAEGKVVPMSEIRGAQAKAQRQAAVLKASKAAEVGLAQARALGLSGQIQTALQIASRAVDLKYKPIEEEIAVRRAQLDAIQPILNKQEKTQALSQQVMLQDREREIADQKEREKQVGQIMVQAAQVGADPATLEKIQASGSLGEAIKNAGDFLSADFRQKIEQQKFENELNLQQLSISRANLAVSRGNLALATRRQEFEEAQAAGLVNPDGQVSPELLAYAQQYAATGTIPTGMPKGSFGLVSEAAKSLPKPDGTLVDINTGIKPTTLSAAQSDGVAALYDLTKKLKQAEELFKTFKTGTAAGLYNSVFPSKQQTEYNTLRSEITDLLARARTGATLNESEIKNYQEKIPSRFVRSFWTGPTGTEVLSNLRGSLEGKLETTLKANGAAIYGYSKVKMPDGKNYTVGTIIEVEGNRYRVNPDGNLTPTN